MNEFNLIQQFEDLRKKYEELKMKYREIYHELTEKKRSYYDVHNLERKIATRETKIEKLENDLANLQANTSTLDEKLLVLRALGATSVDLIKRLLDVANGDYVDRKYSPELRKFALTLHYYSRRAFNYVREKFENVLPHEKTLSRWYSAIPGDPGFNSEALRLIKLRAENADKVIVGALMFDEMSIKKSFEYECGKLVGRIDLGPNIEVNETILAKEALFLTLSQSMIHGKYRSLIF